MLIITNNFCITTKPSLGLMESWLKMLLAVILLPTIQASFLDTYEWVSIDCGAETASLDINTSINWETDASYTKTGVNKNVSVAGNANANSDQQMMIMKTLRSFPESGGGSENHCYSFSVDGITKYLIRARFYYGNYDGLSNPPLFDISVNGNKWTTVDTAGQEHVVIEGIFRPGTDVIRVCLARGSDGGVGVPFISSLEVTPLPFPAYIDMDLFSAFLLHSRIAFGSNKDIRYNGNYTGDQLNRIWKAEGLSSYRNVSSTSTLNYLGYIDTQPPDSILRNAVEAPSPSDSIVIPLNLNQTQQPLYVMLYFMELINATGESNVTRRFQINVGSQKNLSTTIDLQQRRAQRATLSFKQVAGRTNITISPVDGSTLPPVLNAMEVYTTMAMDKPSPSPPTSGDRVVHSSLLAVLVCVFGAMVMYV